MKKMSLFKDIVLGIDIGGTTCKCGVFTTDGTLVYKDEIPTRKDEGGSLILADIKEHIPELMKAAGRSCDEIKGVGIGVPGAILLFDTVLLFIVEFKDIACNCSSFSFTLKFQFATSAVPCPSTFDMYFAYTCPPTKDINIIANAITAKIIFLLFFNSTPPFYFIFYFWDFLFWFRMNLFE